MRVQEGSLHIQIHPSTISLLGFHKPTIMFDSPTCYSMQEKGNKATPPPHFNTPTLHTTNGVTTTDLKRQRIVQEQEIALPINIHAQLCLLDIRKPLQCSITLHTTMCMRKMQEYHSHPSTTIQNK
jgi:hypothetical protein